MTPSTRASIVVALSVVALLAGVAVSIVEFAAKRREIASAPWAGNAMPAPAETLASVSDGPVFTPPPSPIETPTLIAFDPTRRAMTTITILPGGVRVEGPTGSARLKFVRDDATTGGMSTADAIAAWDEFVESMDRLTR